MTRTSRSQTSSHNITLCVLQSKIYEMSCFHPKADHRCCEQCRPKVLRAFKILEDVLLPCAEDLEKVQSHRYGDGDVEASQITDISTHKHSHVRKHTSLFIQDSSDDD
jgi:hypothetical protein